MAKDLLLILILSVLHFGIKAQVRTFSLQEALSFVQKTHKYRQSVNDSLEYDLKHKIFKGGAKPNM